MESHTIISKIDCQGEELRNAIYVESKTIEAHEKLLLKEDAEIRQ